MQSRSIDPFAAVVVLGMALGALVVGGCGGEVEQRPNILLISIDTLRADRLGAYGYPRGTTPAIDALAERSLVFERAYSHAPITATSHMSIFTGVLPPTHGVRNRSGGKPQSSLSPDLPTLAGMLAERGYRRAAFAAGGNVAGDLGFDRGFESYLWHASEEENLAGTREAMVEFGSEPFFIFYHTGAPHDPYMPDERLREGLVDPDYSGRIISERGRLKGDWWKRHRRYWGRVDKESEEDRRHLSDLYDAGVRGADEVIGKLLTVLEETGHSDDTVVILLSDHGEQFQEHGAYLHKDVYEELLHVPLIVSIPGPDGDALRGRRIERVVRLVDVLPTVLSLAGLPAPSHIHGRNLLQDLGAEGGLRPLVFSQFPGRRYFSLRRDDWKLIGRFGGPLGEEKPRAWELYDLRADPGEQVDLLATSPDEHAEIFEDLRAEFERILEATRQQRRALEEGALVELDEETRRQLEALGYF